MTGLVNGSLIRGGGGGPPLFLSISRTTIPANTSGVVAQLTSALTNPTFDAFSAVAGVTIASDGKVSLSAPLASGATKVVNARVTTVISGLSVSLQKVFTLTGEVVTALQAALKFNAPTNSQYLPLLLRPF